MNRRNWAAAHGVALAFSLTFIATHSFAFCRTTTCDPDVSCVEAPEDCCIPDSTGCDTNGDPLSWPNSCVSFNVQEDGSALLNISAAELSEVLDGAYDSWLNSDCAGFDVSISVENRGNAICNHPEFNEGGSDRNANVWMFRDDATGGLSNLSQSIDATTLAISVVSFNYKTAEIYDVDVEINSGLATFTTGDDDVQIDLASVTTHEAGHFMGLDHSPIAAATMTSGYTSGDIGPRSLHKDDMDGMCATYPADRNISANTCEPRGKYHKKCEEKGCQMARGPQDKSPISIWVAALLAVGAVWRRRVSRA